MRYGVEAPTSCTGKAHRAQVRRWPPLIVIKAFLVKNGDKSPNQGTGPAKGSVERVLASTLPSPPLPFKPILVAHTSLGRTVDGELGRSCLGVAKHFSPHPTYRAPSTDDFELYVQVELPFGPQLPSHECLADAQGQVGAWR